MKACSLKIKIRLPCSAKKCSDSIRSLQEKRTSWATCGKLSNDWLNNSRSKLNGKMKINAWNKWSILVPRTSTNGKCAPLASRTKWSVPRNWTITLRNCKINWTSLRSKSTDWTTFWEKRWTKSISGKRDCPTKRWKWASWKICNTKSNHTTQRFPIWKSKTIVSTEFWKADLLKSKTGKTGTRKLKPASMSMLTSRKTRRPCKKSSTLWSRTAKNWSSTFQSSSSN